MTISAIIYHIVISTVINLSKKEKYLIIIYFSRPTTTWCISKRRGAHNSPLSPSTNCQHCLFFYHTQMVMQAGKQVYRPTNRQERTMRTSKCFSPCFCFYSNNPRLMVQKTLNYDEGLLFSDDVIITIITIVATFYLFIYHYFLFCSTVCRTLNELWQHCRCYHCINHICE